MGIQLAPQRPASFRREWTPADLHCVTFKIPWSQALIYAVGFEHRVMLFHLSFGMRLTKQSVGVPVVSPGHLVSACSNDLHGLSLALVSM